MDNLNIIDEGGDSRKTIVNSIINSSYHIYSHLMKFVGANYKSKSWVRTVYEQCSHLNQVTNENYWREAEGKFEEVKRKAIKEYISERNRNAETAFGIVQQSFPNLSSLKYSNALKNFMIEWCKKDSSDLAKDVLEYLEEK